ncbi:MAG: lipopolysaccharide biosynthesis protein, partial [Bradymonadaceae bacterium]
MTERDEGAPGSLTSRTLSGFFWSFSGVGLQAVLHIVSLAVLARLLTPEDFGLVGAALVVVMFATIASQMGVGPALVQRQDLNNAHIRVAFSLSMIMSTLLAIGIWWGAPWIAAFFRMDGLTPVLQIIALIFILQGLGIVGRSILQREMRFRAIAMLELGSHFMGYAVVGIAMAATGWGVWSLVGAHLVKTLTLSLGALLATRHSIVPSLNLVASKQLLFFGSGLSLFQVANYVANYGDNAIVGRWLGAEGLGAYERAYQLLIMPATLLGGVVDRVMFPVMSRVQDDPERLGEAFRRSTSLIALLTLPVSAVIIIAADEIVGLFLGSGWDEVVLPLQILAMGLLFRTSYKISDALARATGKVFQSAWRQIVYAAGILIGAYIGQFYGLAGVATGTLIAIAIYFLLSAQLAIMICRLSWTDYLKAHTPAFLLTTGVALAAYLGHLLTEFAGLSLLPNLFIITSFATLAGLLLILTGPRHFLGPD